MISDWKDMLASVYGVGVDLKNFLYDSQILDAVRLQAPVLSVGNLSMGGTGKTPLIEELLRAASERNLKTAVVARNYKARSRGIHQVDIHRPDGGFFYGDEPFMIATHFSNVDVWTGPQKWKTAQMAQQKEKYQLVLVDDGFQHRSLERQFDLVLVDATAEAGEAELFPKGRFREGLSSLQRADVVILTKTNLASPEQVESWRQKIPSSTTIYEVEFQPRLSQEQGLETRFLAVSGIAQPRNFEKSWRELGALEVRDHVVFPDHQAFDAQDMTHILQRMKQLDCQRILTTEKDAVKLSCFAELKELLSPLYLVTRFRQEPREIYAFLDRCIRH